MRTKEKKLTRRLERFWKIDTSRLAHSVRKCSLASIGCVKTLCVFLHPLVRGKSPNTPCRTRADSTTSGQMLRRWFAKTMHKASCQWLAFLLAKKWQKIFFCHHWPLVFCMIINQHRRAMLQRVWTAPWGGGESQWGNPVGLKNSQKAGVHFWQAHYWKNARSENRLRTCLVMLSCTYT